MSGAGLAQRTQPHRRAARFRLDFPGLIPYSKDISGNIQTVRPVDVISLSSPSATGRAKKLLGISISHS